jgi:4-hydroxyphenylpyruvate dioxygenase
MKSLLRSEISGNSAQSDRLKGPHMNARPRSNPLFINMILLGGTPAEKMAAAKAAGFDQVEVWQQDVLDHVGGPANFCAQLQGQGIAITDYQVLRDFDGAPDALRETKRAEALSMLDVAVELGANTVLTTASSDPSCIATRIDDDLCWLAHQASARQLRIAYEGLAWSAINFTLRSAWNTVRRVNEPNLGIVVDPFHLFVRGGDASEMDGIPMERIFLVQLSDSHLGVCTDLQLVIETARHRRVFPGQGWFPIDTILDRLKKGGYAGPIGIEVFNDTMKSRHPGEVANEAMLALSQAWQT